MAGKCTSCHGTGECEVCKGTGKRGKKTSRGYEYTQCTACKGTGVCRVCHGTRVNPPLK